MCTEYHTVLCNPNTRRSKSWCGLVAEKGRIPQCCCVWLSCIRNPHQQWKSPHDHFRCSSTSESSIWTANSTNSMGPQSAGSSSPQISLLKVELCMLLIQRSEFLKAFLRLGLFQPLKVILIFHPRIFGFLHHLLRLPPEQERRPSKMRKLQKTRHHFLTQECCTWSKEWSNGTSWKRSFWCTWIVTWNGWHMAKHWPHMASSSQGVEDSSLEKATNVSYLIRFSLGNQQKLAPISYQNISKHGWHWQNSKKSVDSWGCDFDRPPCKHTEVSSLKRLINLWLVWTLWLLACLARLKGRQALEVKKGVEAVEVR